MTDEPNIKVYVLYLYCRKFRWFHEASTYDEAKAS